MRILKPILFLVLLLFTYALVAQNSSTTVSQDTCISTSVNNYNTMLRYFMTEKHEIKKLFKTDVMQLAHKRLNIWYEHTLSNNISYEIGLETDILKADYFINDFILSLREAYYFGFDTKLKFYKKKTEKKQFSFNNSNFSGNYFILGASAHLFKNHISSIINKDGTVARDWYYYNGQFYDYVDKTKSGIQIRTNKYDFAENRYMLNFGYGAQYRIGKISYVGAEAKVGLGTNSKLTNFYIMPELNIKAGFSISSFKRIKNR